MAAAAIAYSKLNLTGTLVNADVNAAAAIAYSKLNLAGAIVNADIGAAAAIAYSKLNLTGTLVNADVNAAAAIAYSKLNLATSIVNADVAAAADIARSKLAAGTNDHVVINSGAGALSSEAQLAITRGGTGQATAATAFNALSPVTTKGDLVAGDGANSATRLAVGTNGFVLKANSAQATGLEWGTAVAQLSVTTKTTTYSATSADDVILCDATAGAFTITLPTASGITGKELIFVKIGTDTNRVTVDGSGTETIGGPVDEKLAIPNSRMHIVSDGTNWRVIEAPLVLASYSTNAAQSIPDTTVTIVDYEDVEYDTHAATTTGAAWKFTAQRAGLYEVAARINFANTAAFDEGETASLDVYKNGVVYRRIDFHRMENSPASAAVTLCGKVNVYLAATDYLDVRVAQTNTGSTNLTSVTENNWIQVSSR